MDIRYLSYLSFCHAIPKLRSYCYQKLKLSLKFSYKYWTHWKTLSNTIQSLYFSLIFIFQSLKLEFERLSIFQKFLRVLLNIRSALSSISTDLWVQSKRTYNTIHDISIWPLIFISFSSVWPWLNIYHFVRAWYRNSINSKIQWRIWAGSCAID